MLVKYLGRTLIYRPDFYGHEVLWIMNPSQIDMPGMVGVGYPNEYCIFIDCLSEEDQKEIRKQIDGRSRDKT